MPPLKQYPEAYLELSRTFKMELFAKIIDGFHPLTNFKKTASLQMSDWILHTPLMTQVNQNNFIVYVAGKTMSFLFP